MHKRPTSLALARLKDRLSLIEARELARADAQQKNCLAGLAPGRLHEIAGCDWRDSAAAFGLALALSCRLTARKDKSIVIAALKTAEVDCGRFYAPDNTLFGLDARRVLLCLADDMRSLLWTAEEATRASCVAATIIVAGKPHGLLSLTATRRLQLAAEMSGSTPMLLRAWNDQERSAAHRRYRVCVAPSGPDRDDGSSPGNARWRVWVERCRAGNRGEWLVEFDAIKGEIRQATPLPVSSPAAFADGSAARGEAAA